MNSCDLAATVDAERRLLPQQALAIPSMLSYEERALLHWAAREGCGAAGQVIDAGCYLGGSTLSLATGLSRSAKDPEDARRVHSFDLFIVGGERERVYFESDFPFEVGADIRPLFEANVAPVRSLVEVHPGDVLNTTWPGERVATLFIDIAKSWSTNDHVVRQFFPSLVPGSVVIQQDLVHWGHPWCALTMELLIEHFEYLGHVPFSSAVYRVRHAIPEEDLPSDLLDRLSGAEALRLIDRCAERVGEPSAGHLRLCGATALMYFGDYPGARARVSEVRDDYDDDTVPYISEGFALAQIIDEAERNSSAFCGRSPRRLAATHGQKGSSDSSAPLGAPARSASSTRPGRTLRRPGLQSRAMNATELLASPLLEGSPDWQMRYGERFALEGVLASLKPRLAIEIGTAQGGSLRRIALRSEEVHCFDIVPEIEGLESELPNVRTHVGDSVVLVPEFLAGLEEEGREVDFALVDGDHSAAGVRRDAEALLASEACRRTVIVFHDAANDDVRAGLEAVRFQDYPRVAFANLDFIPGYLVADPVRHLEVWNGLAIVLLDADRQGPTIEEFAFFDSALVLRQARERAQARSEEVEAAPADRRGRAVALAAGALLGLAAGLAAGRGSR